MNKQNNYSQGDKHIYRTQQVKSRQRYPKTNIDYDYNSINDSPKNLPPIINSIHKYNSNYNPFSDKSINKNEISVSLKQKFKLMHFKSVHQLIASARQKKSQIQDLLRKQQIKAQQDDIDEHQLSAGLRRLKKVVRLLQIVCKIIIGRNQQNSYIDLASQQDISLRQINSFSIENYQRELNQKKSQIHRLKKLVQILNVPNKINNQPDILQSSMLSSKHSSINIINNSINGQVFNAPLQSLNEFNFNKIKAYSSIQVQTEPIQFKAFTNQKSEKNKIIKKNQKFEINQQYSLWNILDGTTLHNKQNQIQLVKKQIRQIQQVKQIQQIQQIQQIVLQQTSCSPIKIAKFATSYLQKIHVPSKCQFLKRFKSIVKIAINSINLINNIFIKMKQTSQVNQISEKIESMSQYFNNQYHKRIKNDFSFYDDQFCKQIKQKLLGIYQKVSQIYQERIIQMESYDII